MRAQPVAVIGGVGDGLGGAIARKFGKAGFLVVLAARKKERLERIAESIRSAGGKAHAAPIDLRDSDQVGKLMSMSAELGQIEVAVFNAGAQHRQSLLDVEPEMFEKVWRLGCYAGFVFGQAAGRHMAEQQSGTIIFTGATASVRGGSEFVAFAAAKAGLRSVAQSLARTLGPKNVHVSHVIVDGVVDMPAIRDRFPDFVAKLPEDGMLAPDAVAETYLALHRQPRSAWSFEVDLRPWSESF